MPDPLEYAEQTADDYAKKFAETCTSTSTRRGLLLRGMCPRCGDTMDFQVVTKIFQSGSGGDPGAAATKETPLLCTCEVTHPNRPAGEEGCGAYWNIRLSRLAS